MRHDIFSTPVWHIEETPQQLIDELYEGAYRFKEKYPSNNRSGEGGYQSPIFDWDSFHPDGREVIKDIVSKSIEVDVKVMEWWYNINGKGDWNMPHTHPNSDLALILYVTDSDGLLTLMSPHDMRRIDNKTIGGVGDMVSIDAKKGDIVMFPADINHYVKPNKKEEDRISISMNLQINI